MMRRLHVLLGLLLASAMTLGGCVAQSDDADADDDQATVAVGEARSLLVSGAAASDPTHSASGTDPGTGSIAKTGAPGMADPQPQPWKPPPSGPPADPSNPQH